MIPLDPTLVLRANTGTAPSGPQPVAQVGSRTIPAATKATFEDYQSRLERKVMTGITPVVICLAPTENAFKTIEYIGVWNGSTGALVISVSTFNGTTEYVLAAMSIPTGQGLFYETLRGWYIF